MPPLLLPPGWSFDPGIGKRPGTREFLNLRGFPTVGDGSHRDQLLGTRGLMIRRENRQGAFVNPPTEITRAAARGCDQLLRFT
jgi:hypothetical protein